jgi:L-rhamnose-H+ transport protein
MRSQGDAWTAFALRARRESATLPAGMNANPLFGVLLHWTGGLAAGSFYVPYKGVRKWSWETYWLVGGFFSWIICPWVFAALMTNDLAGVLRQQSGGTLAWAYFFGVLWGIGGLTFGLSVRYLGLSLGYGVALGFCAALGTLLPPVFKLFLATVPTPETIAQIAASAQGRFTLAGVAICLLGIIIASRAGLAKERELSTEQKQRSVAEFSFVKGMLVAIFAGVMSACMNFGLTAADPIGKASLAAGTRELWTGLPGLCVVLLGGFTTNCAWCVALHVRNRSGYQYLARQVRAEHAGGAADLRVPRLRNYACAALAGTLWYFQFFFFTMGKTQMGRYDYTSWTLHMASIIIFSTMWGWLLHEWRGASARAHRLIAAGILLLLLSTIVIGCAGQLAALLSAV